MRFLTVAAVLVAFVPAVAGAELAPLDLESQVIDPQSITPEEVVWLLEGEEGTEDPEAAPPEQGKDPNFADRVASAFADEVMILGAAGLLTVAAGLGGLAMVTRYISPKEALKNPQRSMLYGYVRGNPGVHLKALSEEFSMKTSSILWHIRKLESANLVKSERANGFRVFYAVEGGVELKRVSRAITALQNDNALRIFEALSKRAGATTREVAEALNIHGGTTRWHLRKLRDHGLVDELIQEAGSKFYATPLGDQALETMQGRPVDGPARPVGVPAPVDA